MLGGIDIARGNRSTAYLKDAPCTLRTDVPRVSIIVPARNEEKKIREALQSLLAQDYPYLEFIILNDRSTDRTGEILAAMSAADARLRVTNIEELPPGWLGKNYALYQGAERATGELLLFTDADVVMHPSALAKAVNYLGASQLQHLTVMPRVRMPTLPLRLFCSAFGIFFSGYLRPWRAKDPASRSFIGVGAFNLVTAEAYKAAGTHRAIAMRPDDDLKLGKLLKRAGYRQGMVLGMGLLEVEWYSSLSELIDGLMKNAFAVWIIAWCGPSAQGPPCCFCHLCGWRRSLDSILAGCRRNASVYLRRQSLLRAAALVCARAPTGRGTFCLHYVEIDAAGALERRDPLAWHALSFEAAANQSDLVFAGVASLVDITKLARQTARCAFPAKEADCDPTDAAAIKCAP